MAITENKFFGLILDGPYNKIRQFCILDEHFNIKIIENSQHQFYGRYCLASCLYDDSIFIFDSELTFTNHILSFHAKRYLISQDKWINLSVLPFYAYACAGFKNKIIITSECPEIIIYDTTLDSCSHHTPFLLESLRQTIVKKSGKLYLIAKALEASNIYSCDDPLSEWTFVCKYDGIIFNINYSPYAHYNGSIYYFKDPLYYEFSLETFKAREVKFQRC